jgi:hypothetical protein
LQSHEWKSIALVVSFAVAVLLTGCSSNPNTATSQATGNAAQLTNSPVKPSSISDAMLDSFFPTDGEDFAAGESYTQFTSEVAGKITDKCMVADGFAAPPPTPNPYSGDNTEFPYLSYIKTHGFEVTQPASPSPTKGMSSSEARAYEEADNRCSKGASDQFTQINNSGAALGSQWMNIVSSIDAGTQFQNALKGFYGCMHRAGVDVNSMNDFFNYVSGPLGPSGGNPQAANARLGSLYARCLGPAETLRDHLRMQARTIFYDQHALSINALTSELSMLITRLGSKYGVAWGS